MKTTPSLITATDMAQLLTGRDYVSFSALNTYRQCPLRYFFRYVAGLPEETVSAGLVFGGAVHAAVEFHFRELRAERPAPPLPQLLEAYDRAWQERQEQPVQFGQNEGAASLRQLAERMLATFQQSDFARPEGLIIGIEEEFRQELIPDCPELLGRVDLIVDGGDAVTVTDLKTARYRWNELQRQTSSEQLLLYSELVRQLVPDRRLRLEFAVLTKGQKPTLQQHPVPIDPRQVERTRRTVARVWRAIENEHFYPVPSPLNCWGCPFQKPCAEWTG